MAHSVVPALGKVAITHVAPPLCVRESAGSREGVPRRKNCPHLPPGNPQRGPGDVVMATPISRRPTSSDNSGHLEILKLSNRPSFNTCTLSIDSDSNQ